MDVNINQIGQIALSVADVDRAEDFYAGRLGFRKLFRFGDLVFFDCAGVRLLIEKAHDVMAGAGSTIYFRCADLALTMRELEARGLVFTQGAHLVAEMADHDLWMAFFSDPDGNSLALMQEAPKGYRPV
jgi:methylmalonyl-CoA/ethylmalonyl-CoA epimerase